MTAKKNKKGPTKGSGGKGRRSLEGKKGTLPARERHWYGEHKARAAKKAEEAEAQQAEGGAGRKSRSPERRDSGTGPELLVGRNPVVEALRAKVPAIRLFIAQSVDSDERLRSAAKLAGSLDIEIVEATRAELDRRCESAGHPGAAHQGVVLQVRPYSYTHPDDLLEWAQADDQPPLLVVLDGVTDPHNLGAIARSGAAFRAHGLIVPERRAAGVTTTAWKTSAGALARIPVAQVTNLTRTLDAYKRAGLFVVGLDADGDTRIDQVELAAGPLVVVVGSEGKGLSRLVREACDAVVSIPISNMESLNASVAMSVALYEVARRRAATP